MNICLTISTAEKKVRKSNYDYNKKGAEMKSLGNNYDNNNNEKNG